ncbi:conserved exported hypothetical protein [Planktothrix serta PCC 8927]|uniref:DUF3108 domain-containing protein n=1 Tax=Planktothrix serta PCC 8927 TaxID=671068 RepID=A0A7Z9BLE6_9CYAN|nr:hypothetical protein [Planktothrix serta]VXD16819.1 conserved exported hypothetical protein [Planktothrix serta PCC 8927]
MFKQKRFWGLFLTIVLVMIGFKSFAETPPPPPDYFPLPVGGVWEYQAKTADGKQSKLTVKVEGLETQSDGTTLYKTENNLGFAPFYIWYAKPNGLVKEYRQLYTFGGNNTEYRLEPAKTILKNPPASGDTWTWEGQEIAVMTTEVKENYRVVGTEDIEVPAGKFSTFKVEIEGTKAGTPFKKVAWYGNFIGAIKWQIFDDKGTLKTTTELEKYTFPPN